MSRIFDPAVPEDRQILEQLLKMNINLKLWYCPKDTPDKWSFRGGNYFVHHGKRVYKHLLNTYLYKVGE